MDKKAITLEQMEEALRDLTRWIKDKLARYIAEPAAEGKSGYVLTSNGAGGRSWEPGGSVKPDESLSQEGIPADAAAVGTAVGGVKVIAESAVSAAKNAQAAADAITPDSIGAEKERLQFSSISVSSFSSNTTHADFPYRAAVTLDGVTADMVPEVVFGVEDAMSGVFAPVAESYDGGVYIYASEAPAASITIPVIILWR